MLVKQEKREIEHKEHQEDPSFAFWCFFMLFLLFYEKSRKSMKKPSATLARVLSKGVKKVYCLQKYKSTCILWKYRQKTTSRCEIGK